MADVIASYRPASISAEAADFAREVVAGIGPASESRAKALLYATGRLGAFAASVGAGLVPETVLTVAVIERFIAGRGDLSAASVRTVRSNLFFAAGAVRAEPRPARLSRERAKASYTPAEIAAYLALAEAQPTEGRVMRAVGLIALGAGAGLVGADLRGLRGMDIVSRSGGVIVEVHGPRDRTVPVLGAYQARLAAVAAYFGDRYVTGGIEPGRRNVTTPLISSLSAGGDLARLDMARLRATWLEEMAERIGLRAFMDAAGISCSQRLGDIVARLGPVTEAEAVALLGGASP